MPLELLEHPKSLEVAVTVLPMPVEFILAVVVVELPLMVAAVLVALAVAEKAAIPLEEILQPIQAVEEAVPVAVLLAQVMALPASSFFATQSLFRP
jgi:hypothetical protein